MNTKKGTCPDGVLLTAYGTGNPETFAQIPVRPTKCLVLLYQMLEFTLPNVYVVSNRFTKLISAACKYLLSWSFAL